MRLLYAFTGDDAALPPGVDLTDGFPDSQACGRLQAPLSLTDLDGGWAGGSLQLTLYRPYDHTAVGGLSADDAIALDSPERAYGDCIDQRRNLMLPPGLTHLIIDIAPMRTTQGNRDFDFGAIRSLTLDLGATDRHPTYIRHLRLCDHTDAVGPPASPQPGDSVTYLKNQDLSCYTYALDEVAPTPEIAAQATDLQTASTTLADLVRVAQLGGKQTLYAEAALLVADIALKARPLYPWTNHRARRRRDLSAAQALIDGHRAQLDPYVRGIVHDDEDDDSSIPVPAVPPMPPFDRLRIKGRSFVGPDGQPVALYAMNYHHDGPLLRFFAPDDHRIESYAVGGGSRYDIEWSPVYRAFHQHSTARRVGYRGWCGHLIKDQWAMGGRKENVVLCLEDDAVRQAVQRYNEEHVHQWRANPHLLYNILQYELMYICYCERSVALYRDWLKAKYATIDALNAAWDSDLAAFDTVVPPPAPDGVPAADTPRPAWYDWTFFNTRRFTDILLWAKDNIRQLDPGIPVCAGGTSSMVAASNGVTGIDEEYIVNEVDDVILHEGGDRLTLDLLRSLADRPKPVVDPEFGGGPDAVFKGFLHGKSTVAKFWWPRQPSRRFPHMTLAAPMQGTVDLDEVYEHLRVALDVRRLAADIALFWEAPPQLAVHYSKSSMLQVPYGLLKARTTPYLQTLRLAYDAATRQDLPLGFVSERQLTAGMAVPPILLLPAVRYMPAAVFAAVDAYVRDGGTLVVLPESCLADEYARPQDYLSRWGIAIGRTWIPQIRDLGPAEQGYDQSLSHAVDFGPGRDVTAQTLDRNFLGDQPFQTTGILQQVQIEQGQILAAGDDLPLLVRRPLGQGTLYYFAGTPTPATLLHALDSITDAAGIPRPLRVTDADGRRHPQLEARLVQTRFHDLVYLINDAPEAVDFRIHTQRPYYRLRELRSLAYWDAPAGTIPPRQTYLFKFSEDPAAIARHPEPPPHPYRGL